MMKGPISPDSIPLKRKEHVPELIYEIVNQFLIERSNHNVTNKIVIWQQEIVDAFTRQNKSGFDYKWLYFEESYRKSGWTLKYEIDLAGSGENSGGKYLFSRKA